MRGKLEIISYLYIIFCYKFELCLFVIVKISNFFSVLLSIFLEFINVCDSGIGKLFAE
ncbi:hypothetical protein BACFRA24663_21535 [Bacteroides fragilis]